MRILGPLLLLVLLTGCGTDTGQEPADRPATLLTTSHPVTVLDDGDGAELCLGGVAESLPPQCGGPRLLGWDWADVEAGAYEQRSGVRWGDFLIEGTYDGRDFTPTTVTPADEVEPPEPDDTDRFATPCPEPGGGWPVAASATQQDLDQAFRRAAQLDGYAGSWLDTSRDGRTPEQVDQDAMAGREDVSEWTVNVRVTGDPAAAEAELREVWDGGLCVTTAEHTEQELRRIQDALHDTPGFLSSGTGDQQVELAVIYDDGELQQRLDDEYGEGVVLVWSALQPVE
ncbi:MAG: hypothetical protein WCS84_11295 [Nocardioides sp.]